MRLLVTGAGGMLGRDLLDVLRDVEVTAVTRAALDITAATAVAAAVPGHDVVVNAAAWTDVDDAETAEPLAFALNAVAPATIARAATVAGRAWCTSPPTTS